MPKTKLEVLDDAQKFYVSKGYGQLPQPLTADSLANDKVFNDFYKKYETAYQYYSTAGYPEGTIQSHMGGIDFNHSVDLVVIPAGQKHTQTQAAWGAKGNYYSTSENTPQMMGISPQGKVFDPNFVPPYLKAAHDEKINDLRAKMVAAIKTSPTDTRTYDEMFPPLPNKSQSQAPEMITNKSVRTYEASEDVTALKSTAREIKDTWSVRGKEIHCSGGGLQLYVSPTENEKMKQFDYGVHDTPEQVRFNTP